MTAAEKKGNFTLILSVAVLLAFFAFNYKFQILGSIFYILYIPFIPFFEETIKYFLFSTIEWRYRSVAIICASFILLESIYKVFVIDDPTRYLAGGQFIKYFAIISPLFLHIFLACRSISLNNIYKKGGLYIVITSSTIHYVYNFLRYVIPKELGNVYYIFDSFLFILLSILIIKRILR